MLDKCSVSIVENIFFQTQNIKIEIINIFDYEIIKCKIPDFLYKRDSLCKSISEVFDMQYVIKKSLEVLERNKNMLSTCSLPKQTITNLEDINPLIDYISMVIISKFYKNTDFKKSKIKYNRMWMNRMYEGSSVKCHIHTKDNFNGTAIFYFDAPKDGSNLIIFKDQIESNCENYPDNISHVINVETGDLIIHKQNVPHAVSKHTKLEPRTTFIFDFILDLDNQRQLKYY